MTGLRDYVGIALVALALIAGIAVAAGAYQLAPPAATPVSTASQAVTPEPGEFIAALLGDREAGRVAFRATCQDCHIQGRQSIDPAARGRVELMATRIRRGSGEMPAFGADRVTDDTLRHILAYLAMPAEPEPPPAPETRVRGVNFEILEAEGLPSQSPSVRFTIRDDAGATIAPSELAALALIVGGPTTDYRWMIREDARRAEPLPDGSARYVFNGRLPADAAGTFAAGIEGYLQYAPGVAGPEAVRDTGFNVVKYFGVTDASPVPPPSIVRVESCNQCHGTLALHGGMRRNTELCVICHNVNQTDQDKRATASGPMPPESVLFRNLIHRIHTGEDLVEPFVVYGGSPANPQPINLGAVHPFPRDRANCVVCHEPGTFTITRALEQKSPMTAMFEGQSVRQVAPVTSACVGCHDGPRTQAHVASQTSPQGVEACATCHGAGRPFSVSTVHRVASER